MDFAIRNYIAVDPMTGFARKTMSPSMGEHTIAVELAPIVRGRQAISSRVVPMWELRRDIEGNRRLGS